jgi:hypothetical protein
MHQDGQCADMDAQKRVAIIEAAEKCIFAHIKFGFCTVLHQSDFENYKNTNSRALNSMLDSDYGVSFRITMGFLHSVLPMIMREPYPQVYILAEDGDSNSGAVYEIFKQYKKQFEGKERIIKSVLLVDKNQFPGTQASDIRAAGFLMQETEAGENKHYQDIPADFNGVSEWTEKNKLPWFRLPLNEGVLMDLRDGLILSSRSYSSRFGNLLSKYFWDSSFSAKESS